MKGGIFVFVMLASFFAQSARATEFFWRNDAGDKPWFKSADAACAARNGGKHISAKVYSPGFANCVIPDGNNSTPPAYIINGSAVEFAMPDCPSGQVRDPATGACGVKPPDPPKKCGTPSGGKVTWEGSYGWSPDGGALTVEPSPGIPKNTGTCGVTGQPKLDRCDKWPAQGGGYNHSCTWTGESNGEDVPQGPGTPSGPGNIPGAPSTPANMPPTPAGDNPSASCPVGSVQGGVDSSGIAICVGSGSNPNPPPSTPSTSTTTPGTDSSGNPTTTTSSTKTNSDGSSSTTTTTTTTKGDGSKSSVTSTTTTLAPNGNNGKPDPEQPSLCKQMPDLTICKNSTVSGTCAATACTGDAIQCATLRAAAEMNCRERDTLDELKKSSAYTLGQGIAGGNDPIGSTLPTTKNGATVAMPTGLNASGFLGGGSCFGDKQVTVQGKVISLPFSKACDVLIAFRYALMVVAALVSFRIMSGAILGS